MQAGDQCAATLLRFLAEDLQGVPGQYRIHGRHRFVGEDQLGALAEHAGDADALQLATGKLVAVLIQLVAEVEAGQGGTGGLTLLRVDQVEQGLGQRPVAEATGQNRGDHALARWQWRALVDQADAPAQLLALTRGERPGLLAEQAQLTAAGLQGGGQKAQQTGFAGPGRTDDGHTLALCNGEREIRQCRLAVGVGQAHAGQAHAGKAGCHFSRPAARAASSMPL